MTTTSLVFAIGADNFRLTLAARFYVFEPQIRWRFAVDDNRARNPG